MVGLGWYLGKYALQNIKYNENIPYLNTHSSIH